MKLYLTSTLTGLLMLSTVSMADEAVETPDPILGELEGPVISAPDLRRGQKSEGKTTEVLTNAQENLEKNNSQRKSDPLQDFTNKEEKVVSKERKQKRAEIVKKKAEQDSKQNNPSLEDILEGKKPDPQLTDDPLLGEMNQ